MARVASAAVGTSRGLCRRFIIIIFLPLGGIVRSGSVKRARGLKMTMHHRLPRLAPEALGCMYTWMYVHMYVYMYMYACMCCPGALGAKHSTAATQPTALGARPSALGLRRAAFGMRDACRTSGERGVGGIDVP